MHLRTTIALVALLSGIILLPVGGQAATLLWNCPTCAAAQVTSYRAYHLQSTTCTNIMTPFTRFAEVPSSQFQALDQAPKPGQTWCYYVTSVNSTGESAQPGAVQFTQPGAVQFTQPGAVQFTQPGPTPPIPGNLYVQ